MSNGETKQYDIIQKHLGSLDEENIKLIHNFLKDLFIKSSGYGFLKFHDLVKKNGGEDFDKLFIREYYNSLSSTSSKRKLDNGVYEGRVISTPPYGAFIKFNNSSGLCHVSQISFDGSRVENSSILKPNQKVFVKIIDERKDGKISLSMRGINQENGEILEIERGTVNNKIQKSNRKMTSPERWEARQLIASGAAKQEDYPELNEFEEIESKSQIIHHEPEISHDIELNDFKPEFLKNQPKFKELPNINTILKMEGGAMSKVIEKGSELAKTFRDDKLKSQKQKQHQEIDPLFEKDEESSEKKIAEWKKSKKIAFGKPTTMSIDEQRKSLPVFDMRNDLIEQIKNNQFLVIVGETGSGKTTQIVQYLYEEKMNIINGESKIIGCTQPRRVAATSVAKRVSEEVGCILGDEVGYNVRFDDNTSPKTKIKYMTDGMLEKEALSDPEMNKYSIIMLDEAHERTIATDVLFALLKKAAKANPNLKVIITSATLDSNKFSKYFNNCPIVKIPGRTFPVEILYTKEPEMDYLAAALDSVMQIHISEPPGDILVFLTGQDEIDTSCEILSERLKILGDSATELIILPVYSALPSEMQTKIFEPTPPGSRKVILATNIAETSITIDGIYYVIDPGYVKLNAYDPRVGMDSLKICPISKAQANQRSGRAGRTGPGKCYRLYTEESFEKEMLPNTIPEIQRQNLSHTILMLKAMGIKDLINFEFMDPPSMRTLMTSLEDLYMLEALDDDGEITLLGKKMANFPMEPALAKTLIKSVEFECTEEILTIIAMLSVQTIFFRPKNKQIQADQKRARFNSIMGDHLTLLNVFQRWCQNNYNKNWCQDNFIQERSLKRAMDIKKQLKSIMINYKYEIKSCGSNLDNIRKTLCCGFFKNTAKKLSGEGYKTLSKNESVYLHPSSSLFGKNTEYLLYHTILLTSKEYMQCVTIIDPIWLYEFASKYFKLSDETTKKKEKIIPLFSFHNNNNKKPHPFEKKKKKIE
ncbi:PRP22 [Candida pseudojiufengensis]|uniref:PRP22 n=1 Tax=Candida pseudojiufengensis TaxID=497109 RepID=UPI0022259B79|nr:PRP22 [Candida pseudojiufengensis]KAI5958682.1 PRP22 [Candida pseudojiufengensis]